MVAPAFNMTVLESREYLITSAVGISNSANLLTPQPGEKATHTAAQATLVLDLRAQMFLNQFALLYASDLTNTALGLPNTWRIELSTTSDFTNIVMDTGNITMGAEGYELRPEGYRHAFYHHLSAVQGRYVRLTINGELNRTYGRLMVSRAVQPEYNADYGDTSWGYEEADEPELLDSGVEVLYETTPAPIFQFRLSWLTEEEMNKDWEPLSRLQHKGTPVLVARRPDPHTWRHNGLYYGRLRLQPIIAADFDMYEVQGKIRSMV